ncbi:hypothetical protein Hanom_Chr07g00670571 [Helianthus anomalus]
MPVILTCMVPAIFSHGPSAFLFGFLRSLCNTYMLFGWACLVGVIHKHFLIHFFFIFYASTNN